MPNLQGGKKYKAGKHVQVASLYHEIDKAAGQMVGRVLKNLGDRNVMVYCNDNRERLCHIRGGLSKKKCLIEVGDIVLISIRAEGMECTQGDSLDRGDILTKYAREWYSQLKKEPGINTKLFKQLELMDARQRAMRDVEEDDCGFIIEEASESEDEKDGEDEESKEDRKKKKDAAEKKRAEARQQKETARAGDGDTSDVDVDNI